MNGGPGSELFVLALVADADQARLVARVFAESGDLCVVATDLAEGLARSASEVPDVVFVDVAMGEGGGVAIVHHLRAVAPNASVLALANEANVALATQAMALGASGMLVTPVSGDELLTAVSSVRSRIAERLERQRLEEAALVSRRGLSMAARVAEIAMHSDRSRAAGELAQIFAEATQAVTVLVYLPAGERTRQLMCVHSLGEIGDAPSFCEEMDLLNYARNHDWDVVPLAISKERSGLVVLAEARKGGGAEELVQLIAAQAATTFALIGEREHSHRGAMKDPSSSAYTFAYFVDVAGREIDKARRHGRRFALATIAVNAEDVGAGPPSVASVERILGAVRDTDVLARVDEREFYLLLPETGGIGAHICRRRVQRGAEPDGRRGNGSGLELTMGMATYPHDGTDLSRLLRVAKHRAEASLASVVRRLELDRMPLGEVLDTLLWHLPEGNSVEQPRSFELPQMDMLSVAVSAVSEAMRSDRAHIVATHRGGVSLGMAVKAHLREREGAELITVDLSAQPDLVDIEALALVAEHGCYVLLGRNERGGLMRAVHAADPLLVDLVVQRLGEAVGLRLLE